MPFTVFCFNCFVLRQDLLLPWNLPIMQPGWPMSLRDSHLCLPDAGITTLGFHVESKDNSVLHTCMANTDGLLSSALDTCFLVFKTQVLYCPQFQIHHDLPTMSYTISIKFNFLFFFSPVRLFISFYI